MEHEFGQINDVEDALAFLHFERGAVVVTLPSGQYHVFTCGGNLDGEYTPEEFEATQSGIKQSSHIYETVSLSAQPQRENAAKQQIRGAPRKMGEPFQDHRDMSSR